MYTLPFICWDDKVGDDDTTLTATTEDTGYPIENIGDFRLDSFWKGTGTSEQQIDIDLGAGNDASDLDSMIIMGHDLNTQGATNITLLGGTDGITYGDTLVSAFTPSDDKLIYKAVTGFADRYLRFVIPTGYTAAPSIAILHLSQKMDFDRYLQNGFDPEKHVITLNSNISRSGVLLGMTKVSSSRQGRLVFRNVDPSFIAGDFTTFWNEHINCEEPKAFFLSWEPGDHADQVYYIWLPNPAWNVPYNNNRRTLTLNYQGVYE